MKKFKLNILILSIASIFLNSCDSENDIIKNNETNFLTKVDIKKIGIEHNKGLEYVFTKIKKDNIKRFSKKNISEFNILINKYSIDYAISKGLSKKDSYLINTQYKSMNKLSNNENFSEQLQSFLSELESLSNSDKDDWEINDYFTFISDLENEINGSNINDDEKFIALVGTSVAKSSLVYWNEHISEWADLFVDENGNKISNKSFWDNFNWGAIAISDAAGAVGMAANLALNGTGAAMAATGPGGWVGIGIVIAASSIGSSATAFAAQAMTM